MPLYRPDEHRGGRESKFFLDVIQPDSNGRIWVISRSSRVGHTYVSTLQFPSLTSFSFLEPSSSRNESHSKALACHCAMALGHRQRRSRRRQRRRRMWHLSRTVRGLLSYLQDAGGGLSIKCALPSMFHPEPSI